MQFPSAVAGFRFGIDGGEFDQLCTDSGGRAEVLRVGPPAMMTCTVAPVRLPFPVQSVTAYFCGMVACEFVLAIDGADHDVALNELEARNGASIDMSNYQPCDTAGIRGWTDGTNRIRLYRDCPPGPSLLYYDNADGVRMRIEQGRRQEANF